MGRKPVSIDTRNNRRLKLVENLVFQNIVFKMAMFWAILAVVSNQRPQYEMIHGYTNNVDKIQTKVTEI
jgi:hypothetical protein